MRPQERGAVLLLVLGAVALLSILAVELAARAGADVFRASLAARDSGFRRLFDSGSEIGAVLVTQNQEQTYAFWGDPWNKEVRFSLADEESAVLRVSDESGKVKVACSGQRGEDQGPLVARLLRLFNYLGRHEASRSAEWSKIGAAVLERVRWNSAVVTLDAFREVGLSQKQVFGESGLARYLTCFGDGTINVNTAPRAVLFAALGDLDEELINRIAAYRGKGEGETASYKAFQDANDLKSIDGMIVQDLSRGQARIVRDNFSKIQGIVTTRSSSFSVRVMGSVGTHLREAWAFLKPGGSRLAFEEVEP